MGARPGTSGKSVTVTGLHPRLLVPQGCVPAADPPQQPRPNKPRPAARSVSSPAKMAAIWRIMLLHHSYNTSSNSNSNRYRCNQLGLLGERRGRIHDRRE
ncbi:hypothetical protein HRR83_004524 [Exophiala dermatitidis]|uniref:Uncharacterized protein n=1 Tax=Exophiala dermatitidis TaxID=5970 RepID=A0AAN6F008_EXODE|nr:hypothetical protein HRR76_002151 [Exophiala dermatitidis]KAJ4549255.1 hypothetical protein HRR77_004128 [Exophiala dermatitidis]KAJ4597096.1 hypothetical protein HRR83_004524 [Exophiala dermatitidis]KAJ4613907.1 hypothetical protein HRR85_004191 [Exophiala dermatitidis]KAJ4619939.1 hypothetical protein HRR86_006651 [Exophiala dermatitidis]